MEDIVLDWPTFIIRKQTRRCKTASCLNKKDSIQDTLQSNSRQIDIRKMEHECLGTPLHAAIRGRHYGLVHEFLKLGVDVNQKFFLRYAIYEGCEHIARLIVEPQYGMNTSDETFEAAIVTAIRHKLYLITLTHCIMTNLVPRQSPWWPICLVLCSAAPLGARLRNLCDTYNPNITQI